MTTVGQGKERGQVKVWRLAGFEGLELSCGEAVRQPHPRFLLTDYMLAVAPNSPPGSLLYRGEKLTFSKGIGMATYQPGEVHANWPLTESGISYKLMRINEVLMEGSAEAVTGRSQSIHFPSLLASNSELDAALVALFLRCFETFEQNTSALERESLLLELLGAVLRHCTDDPPPKQKLGREHRAVRLVKSYLRDFYSMNVTLDDLAKLVGLNKTYLLEVFRRDVGISPHTYLTCVRVNHAKHLLCRGLPISQVAYDTGFVDQSHLNRTFKKYVLVTPGQYRRDNLRLERSSWHFGGVRG